MVRSVGIVVLGLTLSCATAFSPIGISPIGKPSIAISKGASCPVLPIRTAGVTLRQGAGTTDWTDLPDGQKPFVASEKTVGEWIEKFKDPRNSMRTVASKMVASMYDEEGKGDQVVDKLLSMMTVEDVHERRAAVQTLGMIGTERVLKEVTDIMLTTDDMVVRASCAKAIGAVALKNPENVPNFPQYALDAMKKAATEIPDPITKLAVMSGLSQIGNDCERGLDTILDICKASDDVALLTQSMNALGSIAQRHPEWQAKIATGITTVKDGKKEIEGYDVLEQMINVQLEKVNAGQNGGFTALGNLGGQSKSDPLAAIKNQMNAAFTKGYNSHIQGKDS